MLGTSLPSGGLHYSVEYTQINGPLPCSAKRTAMREKSH